MTTPDLYPLSLNGLQAAANQRSSREPILNLSEEDLRQSLHVLEDLGLALPARGGVSSGPSRVTKYEHHARTVLNLRRDETALLCLLLLRGPQTPGELRSRSDRLHPFDDLPSVSAALDRLAARPSMEEDPSSTGPLVTLLPRQPGSREARFAHRLGDAPPGAEQALPTSGSLLEPADPPPAPLLTVIAALEARIARLEQRLDQVEGASAGTDRTTGGVL